MPALRVVCVGSWEVPGSGAESFLSQMLPWDGEEAALWLPAEGAGRDPHGPVALPELS